MINPLYQPLPESVAVNGREYRIITDFREYIKLLELLKDDNVLAEEKYALIMQWFLDVPDEPFRDCIMALADFITMKEQDPKRMEENDDENVGEEDGEKQIISYTLDAQYILSGFLECYGIDLSTIPYMHWWKFQMLIHGMNENCELKKRMSYRSIDLNKIKDKDERERIRKIQNQIAITDQNVDDVEIGNAFGNMMW